MTFDRFIRFVDENGEVQYGDLDCELGATEITGQQVHVLEGDPLKGFKKTTTKRTVNELLCPVESVPIFQCVGVNYHKHAQETNFKVPSQPIIFTKPCDSIAGPLDTIPIHPEAQSELDYEAELCFIISHDCKDVAEADALNYVLGYLTGNDLSARNYIPHEISGYQMSYGKSFDKFAPIGPFVASPVVIGDPHNLHIVTKVNGEVRQDANTGDMIWKIPQIIAHLTKGRTLRAGTIVMTGTPSGVGWFMKPQGYVKSGDKIEVTIEKLGSISNEVVF